MRYKVSGAIAIPKASWGCAPALPNRIQMVSLRITIPNQKPQANKKFFDPAIFQKCWRGSGRVAHICGANQILQSVFPAAIAIFNTSQFGISCSYETSCKFGQGNGAIAACWQAKAGVEPPFAER